MTYLTFKNPRISQDDRFHQFPAEVLARFHAFRVTTETIAILENQKVDLNDENLKTLHSFGSNIWMKIFQYLTPKDIFKTIIATRNLNGLMSINTLMNQFFYLRDFIVVQENRRMWKEQGQSAMNCLNEFAKTSESMGNLVLGKMPKLQLLALQANTRIPLNKIITSLPGMATQLKSVTINLAAEAHTFAPPELRCLLSKFKLTKSVNKKLNSLTRLDFESGTEFHIQTLLNILQHTKNLNYLSLTDSAIQMVQPPIQIQYPADLRLEKLTYLGAEHSSLPSALLARLLRSTPHLKKLNYSHLRPIGQVNPQQQHQDLIDFRTLPANSLPHLEDINLESTTLPLGSLTGLLKAACNAKALNLSETRLAPQDDFSQLPPGSLVNITSLSFSNQKIDHLPSILQAAPALKSLCFCDTKRDQALVNPGLTFPGIKEFMTSDGNSGEAIDSQTLLKIIQLMPELEVLDILDCGNFEDIRKVFKDQPPMLSLKSLTCNTTNLSQDVLEFLLEFAPNLRDFPIDHDTMNEGNIEIYVEKFCKLILKGHEIIRQPLDEALEKLDSWIDIDDYIAREAQAAPRDETDTAKRALEDREDSAPKRKREG